MPDIQVLIGAGVVVLLLLVLLLTRKKKKPEAATPVHVPPNPFDKPLTSGPVSSPGPVSGPVSSPGPVSGPISGPIPTSLGIGPSPGPTSSPGVSTAADVDALLAGEPDHDPGGGTQKMARPPLPPEPEESPAPAPMKPIEEEDDATQAVDHPPVSMDDDAASEAETAKPPEVDEPPPPPARVAKPPVPPAKPALPKPIGRPTSDPSIKPPASPAIAAVAAKATSPATPLAKQEPTRPKLPSRPDVPQDAELDFSALRDKKISEAKLGVAAPAATTSAAAKYAPASSPETAELEKSDPRHAAARRLARLSVSEIKLYHEAEVTEGRAKKDLWKRLLADITLATQTYDKRVEQEIRDRFDYVHDEIVRQLADGNAELLGADAPKPKSGAGAAPAPSPAGLAALVAEAKAEPPQVEAPKPAPEPQPETKRESKPDLVAESSKVTAPAVTRRAIEPSNPETAELEKSDPRHAAARRLARLSVSEIKLYHEAEVTEGRLKKDLYTRLGADISLAKQTFEKRVDQEVRDRHDYLYDEIVRQLAEGNDELLGPGAPPKPAKKPVNAAPAPAVEAKAEPTPPPAPVSEPKVEAKPEPAKVEAPKPAEPVKPTMPGVKYAPPSSPETAELEKSDPRHAAARRLARLSVSEIKLYHEAEVAEGRAKKDLYSRLGADISLAKQTYEKRVDQEVRDRFDYVYDEIVRQLAEGNEELLGKDAPPRKKPASAPAPAAPAPAPAPAPEPAKVEEAKPEPPPPAPAEPTPAPAPEPVKAEEPKAPAPAQATQPSLLSKYLAPSNPKTADLEKADPRHAAARRLARLSVSEIKLYHEAEVTEGRVKKDLYTRLGADISLAKQTFEKRVDQEVRDRFDYLYDEIVRQLAEGNDELLGSGAPPKPPNN